ncbi:MAG: hypothetical protein JO040_06970 [Gemmatimonadetes bacterium]|nr:hypothetical protein [Gemmatimonadota bacterium]
MSGAAEQLLTMAKLAVRGMRPGGGERPSASLAPRRRIALEERVAPDPGRAARYLRATDGERIGALGGDEGTVSPCYCATWETAVTLRLLSQLEGDFPLGGVLHLESELLPLRPLRADDHVRCRLELERSETTPRGVRLTLTARNWNGAEQLCSQSTAVYLIRSRDAAASPASSRQAPDAGEGEGWEELHRWALRSGAGRRYALASGDYNPIHLWSWTARPFGFRRPILHGHCTRAMVAHVLIERRFRGDPTGLRRLGITFRAPLLLPARVCLQVRETEGRGEFRVVGEDGAKVYAEGSFAGA